MARATAWLFLAVGLAGSNLAGCYHQPVAAALFPPVLPPLVVIAPHPDDEILMAGGVLYDAVREGRPHHVIILTNGDYACRFNGYQRNAESLRALARLGVTREHISFLGYPDGHLIELTSHPLAPLKRMNAVGVCDAGNTTYADVHLDLVDEHTSRTGQAAPYTASALIDDLVAVLERIRPRDVYISHSLDDHPDHAATYMFFRRALEASHRLPFPMVVHRALVHAGPCWPNGNHLDEPCPEITFRPWQPFPSLPAPLATYQPNERRVVPLVMRTTEPAKNVKFLAITDYVSQTGPTPLSDWLSQFVRPEEWFFTEQLAPSPPPSQRWQRRVHAPAIAPETFRIPPHDEGVTAGISWQIRSIHALRPTYVLWEHGSLPQLQVRRLNEASNHSEVLRSWRLPRTWDRHAPHMYEVELSPWGAAQEAVEITVRHDGQFLFVAVDPAAR